MLVILKVGQTNSFFENILCISGLWQRCIAGLRQVEIGATLKEQRIGLKDLPIHSRGHALGCFKERDCFSKRVLGMVRLERWIEIAQSQVLLRTKRQPRLAVEDDVDIVDTSSTSIMIRPSTDR